MNNLILITSVINTPNKPLSYTKNRSVFTRNERFEQTKKTILTVREKVPNSIILLVECSDLNEEESLFLNNNCDYLLNLWEQKNLHKNIFGLSKSLGEGTQTICAINFIIKNNIKFKYFFKISGRYWLDEDFIYSRFDNNKYILKKILNNHNNIFTALYKFPNNNLDKFKLFLESNINLMKKNIGYEILFAKYINKNVEKSKIIFYDDIGCNGLISYTGLEIEKYYDRYRKK